MTLTRPSATVTLDGQKLTSAEGAVLRVRVRLGRGPAHDSVEIFCWPSSKLKSAKVGSQATVALGPAGSETDVWTGEITCVRLTPNAIALEGLAPSVKLSRAFVSQTFVSVSVSDVVKQLVQAGGVDVGDVSGDTSLSAYAVDDRRSAWAHLNDLAQLVGADVTVNAAGALGFASPSGGGAGGLGGALSSVASAASALLGGGSSGLRFGANVIEWRALTRDTPGTNAVASYGAASEQGSEKWHWLKHTVDPTGDGPVRISSAIRTRDGATALSDAIATRAKRSTRRTTVVVVGDASLRPVQTTTIADLPGDAGGDLRIVGVEHTLDADAGFLSRVTVELST
jgi:hypothetical protein